MKNATQTHLTLPPFAPDPTRPLALLRVCPVYQPTPLHKLSGDDGQFWLKDESGRMGLGAFKALGGVYAVAMLVAERWAQAQGAPLSPERMMQPEVRAFAASLTFVCASAGNHGLAVAAGARVFGARARVFLSQSVPSNFAARLQAVAADVVISGTDYEASCLAAQHDAEATGAILLADGSWPGYSHAPSLVMEGYTVMAEEMRHEFAAQNSWPSHVFFQAGVGGLAAAIAYMVRANWTVQPEIIIVEPDAAPCLGASHDAGRPVTVAGPVSSMGRLDCKDVSHIAFAALEVCNVQYLQISDDEAEAGAAMLAAKGFATTPSGAAGYAGLMRWRQNYEVGPEFRPLVIVSEGPE